MLTVYLLRHGETAYNADGNKYCGRTDVDLTNLGIQQAKRVGDLLKDVAFDGVFCSPLKRAIRTAEIACGGSLKVEADPRLIEIDFGQWEGFRPEEFQKNDPQSWENWLSNPLHNKAGR